MSAKSQTMETRAKQFLDKATKLNQLSETLGSLRAAGVKVRFSPAKGERLAKMAESIAEQLKKDQDYLHNPTFDLKYKFLDRLQSIVSDGNSAATRAWQTHIGGSAYGTSQETIGILRKIPKLRRAVDKLSEIDTKLKQLANEVPKDPVSAIELHNELIDAWKLEWSRLGADEMSTNVINFIRQAGTFGHGAPLSVLNTEIRAWIENHGLSDSFRIQLK